MVVAGWVGGRRRRPQPEAHLLTDIVGPLVSYVYHVDDPRRIRSEFHQVTWDEGLVGHSYVPDAISSIASELAAVVYYEEHNVAVQSAP